MDRPERTWPPVLKTDHIGPIQYFQGVQTRGLDTIEIVNDGGPEQERIELPCTQIVCYNTTETVHIPAKFPIHQDLVQHAQLIADDHEICCTELDHIRIEDEIPIGQSIHPVTQQVDTTQDNVYGNTYGFF